MKGKRKGKEKLTVQEAKKMIALCKQRVPRNEVMRRINLDPGFDYDRLVFYTAFNKHRDEIDKYHEEQSAAKVSLEEEVVDEKLEKEREEIRKKLFKGIDDKGDCQRLYENNIPVLLCCLVQGLKNLVTEVKGIKQQLKKPDTKKKEKKTSKKK